MNDELLEKLSNYTLLFVENEDGIRKNFNEYFSLIFKEVYLASNGIDGYKCYQNHKPSFIITDIKMPLMDGIELVKKIRSEDTDTPVVIISAHTEVNLLLSSIPLGLVDYIVKPLNERRLEKVFKNFLSTCNHDKFNFCEEDNTISFGNDFYELTAKENIFVSKLVRYKHKRVVSYEEIELDIWDGKEMSPNALRIFIKNLRKKLPKNFIQNVTNQGYKLGI